MIATRTRTWWQHFSAAGVLFALASCSSEAVAPPPIVDDDEPGALQGELAVYIADYDDGTTDTRYFLKVAEGDERRLHFSAEPDVTPGARVKIWGHQQGEKLAVTKYKLAAQVEREGIGSQQQKSELVDAAQKPGRVLCAALVNVAGGTAKTTLDAVKKSFHEGTTSVNAYYRENSFGQVGLEGGEYGPFTYGSFPAVVATASPALRGLFWTMRSDSCCRAGPAAREMIPATPPPCARWPLAALTIASTGSSRRSPRTTWNVQPVTSSCARISCAVWAPFRRRAAPRTGRWRSPACGSSRGGPSGRS